ncbi:hypothetical protein IWX64_002331 [Arthrobacter sp. CAN_A212]|uniref:hypothetical protein n=1 Tax=Arthrobacter sp. CAN_C5 TaxID=2760706 RepID=UPI001A2CC322|nr:hypothetical protein [Arthrobacter sp. CAN_C5]MBP2217691.1 hypothetical protein [Arthrobacter sp. CAN_C5]
MAEDRAVTVLHVAEGPSLLTLTPGRAQHLGVSPNQTVRTEDLAPRLAAAGIRLNGPDCLFYLPATDHEAVRCEPSLEGTRQLTPDDHEAFARFTGQAPAADLDEAFVELDHWLAFGTFSGGRLVAAASMYPWRAISSMALQLGYEPQYRCQRDNGTTWRRLRWLNRRDSSASANGTLWRRTRTCSRIGRRHSGVVPVRLPNED